MLRSLGSMASVLILALSGMHLASSYARAAAPGISEKGLGVDLQNVVVEDVGTPAIRVLTDKDGLPLNSVMTLERDRRGYLWIGTQDGAAVYDGHNLTVVDMPNKTASNYIYDILSASDGSIWFATGTGGVHRYFNGEWQSFGKSSGLVSDAGRCLLETHENGRPVIWVGTRDGLSQLKDGKWITFDEALLPDKRIRSFLQTTSDEGVLEVWVGTYGGVLRLRNGEKQAVINTGSGLPSDVIFSLYETDEEEGKTVWIGTEKGLAKLLHGRVVTDSLPKTGIRGILKTLTPNGLITLWVATEDNGLLKYENGRWSKITENNGLPNNLIFSITETGSPDGSIWIATLGGGVARIERSGWVSFSDKNGLPNKTVFSIAEDARGSIWLGTFGGGIANFTGGDWKVFDDRSGLVNNFIQSLLVTGNLPAEQNVYAGTEKGIARYNSGSWSPIDLKGDRPLVEIWDIYETTGDDGQSVIWIATNGGLVKLDGSEQTVFSAKDGLPGERIQNILETDLDGKKTLWVGTYKGLARFENNEWTTFDSSKHLPNDRIYDLTEIRRNGKRELWVGTAGGVAYFNLDQHEPSFENLSSTTTPALPNDTAYRILQDTKDRIYITSNKGVSRLTPKEDGGFELFTFTTADGLPSNECVSGAGFVDSKGRIWVGTVAGAAMLDIDKEVIDNQPKPIYIDRVYLSGKLTDLLPNTELPYSENQLAFEFTLVSPFRESANRYRSQLVGLEPEPTAWTTNPRREYTFIPDGDFTFRLWGMDANGNVSGPVEIPFTIRPAWWRTWWAFGLYLLATGAIVALIAFLIYRNRLLRMVEVERVRTRIATDLHDDIGASLSQISILSELLVNQKNDHSDEERRSLNIIAETSRQLTSSMSDVVWSINPNRDRVRDLVQRMRRFAYDTLSARDIEFSLITTGLDENERLDINVRQQIYLVFKEAVNNAVKHSGATEVESMLGQKDGYYNLIIRDNGHGFDLEKDLEGNGLINMRTRAASAGGRLKMASVAGGGTAIDLIVARRS